jgi:hypothetical protein
MTNALAQHQGRWSRACRVGLCRQDRLRCVRHGRFLLPQSRYHHRHALVVRAVGPYRHQRGQDVHLLRCQTVRPYVSLSIDSIVLVHMAAGAPFYLTMRQLFAMHMRDLLL